MKRKYYYEVTFRRIQDPPETLIRKGFVNVDSLFRSPSLTGFVIHSKLRSYRDCGIKTSDYVLADIKYGPMIPTPKTVWQKVKTFIKWGQITGTNVK